MTQIKLSQFPCINKSGLMWSYAPFNATTAKPHYTDYITDL